MPLAPSPPRRDHDETAHVIQHFSTTLHRVLDFLGYTIHDVVNDPLRREHVRRAYLLSLRIDRDLAREPWRPTRRPGRRRAADSELESGRGSGV